MDDLAPGERWCRSCHRLESEVPMYSSGHGAVCRACYLANNALRKYWIRYWRTERDGVSTLRRWCPVHELELEVRECWEGCLPERAEFLLIRRAFSVYWWRRRHGEAMSIGSRRRCFWCGCLFVVTNVQQRYCNESHARAAQRGRRNERLVAA